MIKLVIFKPEIDPASAVALARAIIHQALCDMVSKNTSKETIRVKGDVNNWFFTPNRDFVMICELANVQPDMVRARAREVKLNPSLLGDRYAK